LTLPVDHVTRFESFLQQLFRLQQRKQVCSEKTIVGSFKCRHFEIYLGQEQRRNAFHGQAWSNIARLYVYSQTIDATAKQLKYDAPRSNYLQNPLLLQPSFNASPPNCHNSQMF